MEKKIKKERKMNKLKKGGKENELEEEKERKRGTKVRGGGIKRSKKR